QKRAAPANGAKRPDDTSCCQRGEREHGMKVASIYGPVQQDLRLVEETIEGIKRVENFPALSKMLDHVLAPGGKRLRPAIALLAGKFGDYDVDLHVALAASIELLHTATLVHDDVIDASASRRG